MSSRQVFSMVYVLCAESYGGRQALEDAIVETLTKAPAAVQSDGGVVKRMADEKWGATKEAEREVKNVLAGMGGIGGQMARPREPKAAD